MIAWVSPPRTVRSTPRRISLTSSPSPTVTCRSRISRTLPTGRPVACGAEVGVVTGVSRSSVGGRGEGGVDVHENVVALHPDRVDGNRLGGREVGGLGGAQVEAGAVQGARDGGCALELLDLAVAQRDLGVGADVLDGEELAVEVDDRDVDVGQLDPQRPVLGHLGPGTDTLERHAVTSTGSYSSSGSAPRRASFVFISRFCISVLLMCWTTSSKNPRTTRRQANSASMPREQR